METKSKFYLIISLCLITTTMLPGWKYFFSKQDKINPEAITEEYDKDAVWGIFNNEPIKIPKRFDDSDISVLGENTYQTKNIESDKRIEVDLTRQITTAYEGNKVIYRFLISSGTWNRTPTGEFTIWTKVRKQKMSGGSKSLGTYYYLPNVQYVMFFYNDKTPKMDGYSFHEAYWHNNFGVPMSHGCINMRLADSKKLYEWADIGTKINISGKYRTILPKI